MATQTNTGYFQESLPMILKSQSHLCDLHTHLLGMGNASFWVDTILMDPSIMPTNFDFNHKKIIRNAFCPLIWDQDNNTGFVDGKVATKYLRYLVKYNILPIERGDILPVRKNDISLAKKTLEDVKKDLKERFPSVCDKLINKELNGELLHGGLNFRKNFSYDVVLKLSDLAKGLGIKQMDGIGLEELAVTEKLLGYASPGRVHFRDWIIFNARDQRFEVAYGIQVKELRNLITVDPNQPDQTKKLARAHVINAFSMCDAKGTPARLVDFHTFHGSFTPEFYPRRFALKDSIYSQRLDVLAALIKHVLERYQISLPPVKYCEISVSVSDLSSPWVFDVLRSIPDYHQTVNTESKCDESGLEKHEYKATDKLSSFSQIVRSGHFPYLKDTFNGSVPSDIKNDDPSVPHITYKFLAGFGRQKVKPPLSDNQGEALRLLYDSPQQAILLMMEEIIKSKRETDNLQNSTEVQQTADEKSQGPFSLCLDQLKTMKSKSKTIPYFYNWVVGLDLFGDELGYPYCPFVASPFIEYIRNRRKGTDGRKKNERFGVRIHCGENVIFADNDSPAYRLFVAHMYIVFRCLCFLQEQLKDGIRVGHGIAFNRILDTTTMDLSIHRKSSVLLAEMREYANHLFKKIAFEVNITSNEYLLGQVLRQGNFLQTLRLDALFKLNVPIVLGTDDDGIWPIDHCKFVHPGHHSLSAEYCRAISSSLFSLVDEQKQLNEAAEEAVAMDVDADNTPAMQEGARKATIKYTNVKNEVTKKAADRLKKILENAPNFCFWDTKSTVPEGSNQNRRASSEKPIKKNATSELPDEDLLPLYDNCISSIIIHPSIVKLILNEYETTPFSLRSHFQRYKTYLRNSNTSDDFTIWEKTYGPKRVSFICVCANANTIDDAEKNKIQKEYSQVFGTTDEVKKVENEFNYIYNNWRQIRSEFVFPQETLKTVPHVRIIQPNTSARRYVVYSEPPNDSLQRWLEVNLQKSLEDSLQKSLEDSLHKPLQDSLDKLLENTVHEPLQDSLQRLLRDNLQRPIQDSLQKLLQDSLQKPLQESLQAVLQDVFIDFLRNFRSQKVTIYAFAQHMDIEKTVEAINQQVDSSSSPDEYKHVELLIFMNKNKYKYTYKKIDSRFKLQVNPKPTRRDLTQQSFLYALCPHASAATAALHIISTELANMSSDSTLPVSDTSLSDRIASSVQSSRVEASSEQTSNNRESFSGSPEKEREIGTRKRRKSSNVSTKKKKTNAKTSSS